MTGSTLMPISSAWCARCGHRYQQAPVGLCWQEVSYRGLTETCSGRIIQLWARVPDNTTEAR